MTVSIQPKSVSELIKMSKNTVVISDTQYTLNIGLVASAKFDLLAQSRVINPMTTPSTSWAKHAKDLLTHHVANNVALKLERELNLPLSINWRIAESDTEPTLVFTFDLADTVTHVGKMRSVIRKLADYYAQDCIAVRHDSTLEGYLIGRHSAEWGEFNPEYFISQ